VRIPAAALTEGCPLDRLCFSGFTREHPLEFVARADLELREHLVQVVLDGPRADEQLRADLGFEWPSRASSAISVSCAVT
jgi:hypothetical protein